jgi:putative membrane protein
MTTLILSQRFKLNRDFWVEYGPITVWFVGMTTVPILNWTVGPSSLPFSMSFTVVLQLIAVLNLLGRVCGLRRMAVVALTVGFLGWLVEFIGSRTGFPFGSYDYTGLLQPQLAGVPLLVPLAWLMMLPCAWGVAQSIGFRHRFVFVLISAVAFTAWDLFLDPLMVAWNFWTWNIPGEYFGIPLVNFGGWLLASAIMTAVAAPGRLPARPLLLIYTVTWLLQSMGLALFWGLPSPALIGFIVMGAFVLLAWRGHLRGSAS